MGYRSDVTIILKGDMEKVLSTFDDGEKQVIDRLVDDGLVRLTTSSLVFVGEGWRWYNREVASLFGKEPNPEIDALEALWEHADQCQLDIDGARVDGAYIVLGEDLDDIKEEYIGDGWDLVRIVRRVEVLPYL